MGTEELERYVLVAGCGLYAYALEDDSSLWEEK